MPTAAPANFSRLVQQHLESLRGSGLTHLPVSPQTATNPMEMAAPTQPVSEIAASPASPPPPPPPPVKAKLEAKAPPAPPAPTQSSQPQQTVLMENTSVSTVSSEERSRQLASLSEQVAKCTRCRELADTRTQTVFGVGNPEAQIMFVGEAPGADEDRQGEPFVGRAGQLMNKIIEACQLKREDIYICNILRCRPPGNRNPTSDEAANCREYLDGQISTVDPDYIVCWGSVAAQNLLETTRPIGKMRGDFFTYGRAKVLCTYHPSYLLRNPSAKQQVWEDMKFLMRDLGVEL